MIYFHVTLYQVHQAQSEGMGQRYTLFFTAREGREDDLRWALHDRKISPDLRDPDTKQTALHLAAAKGRVGCVRLLIDAGKSLCLSNENWNFPNTFNTLDLDSKFLMQ